MAEPTEETSGSGFDHDAWLTLASTGAGYGIVLLGMFLALFVLPFLVFLAV